MYRTSEEARFYAETIVATVREPLIVLDQDLRVVSASPAFYRQFQMTREESEKRLIYELGNLQWDIPSLRHLLEALLPQRTSVEDYEVRHHFEMIGEKVLLLNARRMEWQGKKNALILLAIEDITFRQVERHKLAQSEATYRTLVEEINSIIIGFNPAGAITFFNHFSEKLFGYSRAEVIGKPFVGTIIPIIDSNGRDNSRTLEEVLADPGKYYANESEGMCKDGRRILFSWSAKAMRDAAGAISEVLVDGNDITKLLAARKELEEKSAMLDALLGSIPEAIIITDAAHVVIGASRFTGEVFGVPPEQLMGSDEPTRLAMLELYRATGERIERPGELPLSKTANTGKTYTDFEITLIRDGMPRTLSLNAAPVRDVRGNIIGAVGGWHDITERKRAEEELRRVHGLIHSITQGTGDMIAAEDLHFRYTYFNEAYAREFERLWKQEIQIGTSMSAAMAPWPEEQHKARELWSRALNGESFAITMEFGPDDQGKQFYDLRFNPLRDMQGRVIGAAHFLRNVTEEIYTKQALDKTKRHLALALEAAALGWWQYDPVTRITTWDDGFRRIFGVSGYQRLNVEDLAQLIHTEDLPGLRARVEAAMNPGEPRPFASQYRIIRPDGETRWIEAHGIVSFEGEGENRRAVNFVGTAEDITEQVSVQEALRRSEANLATIIDALPVAVITADAGGRLTRINPAARVLWGNPPRTESWEQYGNWIGWWPETGQRLKAEEWALARTLRTGEEIRNELVRNEKFGTSEQSYYLANAVPLRDEEGRITGGVVAMLDVTDRREIEQALHENEEKFRAIFEQAAVGIGRVSFHDAKWIDVNSAFCNMLGYTAEEFKATPWPHITHADDVDLDLILFRQMAAGKLDSYTVEKRFIHKKGHSVWARLTLSLVRDAQDAPDYEIAIIEDITERKQAEEALRRSEERWNLALNSFQEGAIIATEDEQVIYWNPAAQQMHGFTRPDEGIEPLEKTPVTFDLLTPDDGHLLTLDEWPMRRIKRGETVRDLELRIRRPDQGWEKIFSYSGAMVDTAGGERLIFLSVHDLTEQRKLEQARRESEARLQLALEAAHMVAWEYDPATLKVTFSENVEKILDLPRRHEDSNQGYDLIHPSDVERHRELVTKAIASGGSYVSVYRHAHGECLAWLEEHGKAIVDQAGRTIRLVGVVQNITTRKQAEEDLRQRTEQLAVANRDLESFSYSVSHDLRNPLRAIGSFSDILAEDFGDRLDEEGRAYLRRIKNGVDKMHRLIEDMLTLSRIGRQEFKLEDVDLSAIVNDCLQDLMGDEPERQAEFVVQGDVHAHVDARLMHLALENLLRNAWKFTAREEVARIEFGTTIRDNQTVCFIRDNGVGFEMQYAARIFEPFKRVHAEQDFGGSGVGLSIVQRVIGRHGGMVWAEGDVDRGAIFYFTIA